MIQRAIAMVFLFAGLLGFCIWGIGKQERGIAFKWVLRGAFCLLFGIFMVGGYALIEGLAR